MSDEQISLNYSATVQNQNDIRSLQERVLSLEIQVSRLEQLCQWLEQEVKHQEYRRVWRQG